MKAWTYFAMVAWLTVVVACGSKADWQPKDLIAHGIPITVLAPDTLDVTRSTIAFQEDITIQGPDGYALQVFVSDAFVNKPQEALRSHRESVRENPYFKGFLDETEDGFLFENQLDSLTSTFGFRHVRIMGGKEYVFQEPLMGTVGEDLARQLFEAVSYRK